VSLAQEPASPVSPSSKSALFDLLLLDVSLPDRNGLDLLKEIRRRDPHLSVCSSPLTAPSIWLGPPFKSGAMDYITKPWSNDELLAQVAQAVESRRLRERKRAAQARLKQRFSFPSIIGKSEKMLTLLDLVTQVAPSAAPPCFISGESGTGKELIAKAIHSASTRGGQSVRPRLTPAPSLSISSSLSFSVTSRVRSPAPWLSKKGLFEVADQGTIFFDEIATISPETQAKLLRVIQEREFMRLGGTEQIKVDVRIVAASNWTSSPLSAKAASEKISYHRLNVIHLQLPPLRDRREDIPRCLRNSLIVTARRTTSLYATSLRRIETFDGL